MPRLRVPGGEHERLVLIAQIAGFVVVIAVIAGFVLFAATSGDGTAVAKDPAVPTITDAGETEPTITTEPAPPPPPPVTTTSPTRDQVAKPDPRPAPKPTTSTSRKPAPAPPPAPPDPGPDDGVQTGDPWDECAPEGARGFTKNLRLPMVCHDGRWHLAALGRGGPGRHKDGGGWDGDRHGGGHGDGDGH